MSLFVIVIIASVVISLVSAIVMLASKSSKLREQLEAVRDERKVLVGEVNALKASERRLSDELESRFESRAQTHRILALGMQGTGKTTLTLKWANPLVDGTSISPTTNERYQRSVSRVRTGQTLTDHVFEVLDWGGEHMVEAVQALSTEEIHGLLLVVDLGVSEAKQVDMARVKAQLQEFQPQALRYFFVPKLMSTCKSVVLFINKSDLVLGTPEQVEEQAKYLFQPLIDGLVKAASPVEVKVVVGSAKHGHSTQAVFSQFIEKILPKEARDEQLRQQLAAEVKVASSMVLSAPPLPPSDALAEAPTFVRKPVPRQNTLRGSGDTAAFLQKQKSGGKRVA